MPSGIYGSWPDSQNFMEESLLNPPPPWNFASIRRWGWTALRWLVQPLRSRKVRLALGASFAVYLTAAGFPAPPEVIISIIATSVALILGIAIEDAGAKSATVLPDLWPDLDLSTLDKEVHDA